MRLFFVVDKLFGEKKLINKLKPQNLLLSYYYLAENNLSIREWLRGVRGYKPNIFLDSGAFTATTQNRPIDIRKYAIYLRRNARDCFVYCGLDVIGNAEETYKNQLYLESQNLKPLYTFHQGEDFDYLRRAKEKYDYIALGGTVSSKKKSLIPEWFEKCFEILNPEETKIKVHGFGMTNFSIIKRFPFYSVDSSSWLVGAEYGQICIWDKENLVMKSQKLTKETMKELSGLIEKHIDPERLLRYRKAEWFNEINMSTFLEAEADINDYYNKKGWNLWDTEVPKKTTEVPKIKSDNCSLPESTKGKIQEILRTNPEARKKQLQKLKGNLFAFKTGRYVKYAPLYCNDCYAKDKCPFYQEPQKEGDKVLCALREEFKTWFKPEDFDYREENLVNKTKNRILKLLLEKLAVQTWFEILDGGIQDRAATQLAIMILDRLRESPKVQINQFNINQQIARTINNLDERTREKIIRILEESARQDKSGRDTISTEKSSV